MKLTMILRAGPDSPVLGTAQAVLTSWLEAGNEVGLLFLQSDGVQLCRQYLPGTYPPLLELIERHQLPTLACVGSAASRSLCDDRGAPVHHWPASIRAGSLGELAHELNHSDRVVTLG